MEIDCAGITLPASSRRGKQGADPVGDDVVGIRSVENLAMFYLADGATGVGYGGIASKAFADAAFDMTKENIQSFHDCVVYLREVDEDVRIKTRGEGDTTGIIAVTDGSRLWGASAGDSMAYLYAADETIQITLQQQRRPRFGSGAVPVGFSGAMTRGDVVLMASDGLWNWVRATDVEAIMRSAGPANMKLDRLVALVREQNHTLLPDDLSLVIVHF